MSGHVNAGRIEAVQAVTVAALRDLKCDIRNKAVFTAFEFLPVLKESISFLPFPDPSFLFQLRDQRAFLKQMRSVAEQKEKKFFFGKRFKMKAPALHQNSRVICVGSQFEIF